MASLALVNISIYRNKSNLVSEADIFKMVKFLTHLYCSKKTAIVLTFDFFISVFSFIFAFILRLGELPSYFYSPHFFFKTLILSSLQVICFYMMGNYKGIWRFSSTPDLLRVIKGVSLAVPVSFLGLFLLNYLENVPRSIFIIQWFLLLVGLGGGRFAYRLYRDNYMNVSTLSEKRKFKTLVVGAGYAGQQLLRDIKNDIHSEVFVVGLIDDDFNKRGKIIHGVKVLGNIADLSQVAKKTEAAQVVIAIPSMTKEQMSRIIVACDNTNLIVRTIPKLGDLISGKLQITKLRNVTPSDLLGRDQVELNIQSMSHMITDKIVIVTGAGGSIGSELCVQILKFKPNKLICFDMSELNMYELGFKLGNDEGFSKIEYVIGDVRDAQKIEGVFEQHRPDVAFHAAAYKHVPMMELNPIEAIKVNVMGTQIVAGLADKYKLEKFVLISTDKAVNPTNVMGTTKRIAEMVCQSIQKISKTKYSIVRFGNVLGSSGSVIPRFQKQIEAGGPVTVTHPEILRYFMSIPEAAQLVIQAGAIGNGGEILVLDMGEPIKIDDLAKQMITLAGFKVGEDIEVVYTGLRPGEKLYEELLADGETTIPTTHERVRVARVREVALDLFEQIAVLSHESSLSCIRTKLKLIVPEYDIPEDLIDSNVINIADLKRSSLS